MIEKKFNYVYKLTFKLDPRYYYFGKHSSNLDPKEDPYLGSGWEVTKLKKEHGWDCFSREILSFWNTKREALLEEHRILGDLWKTDPFCLNRTPGGANDGKFDCTGMIAVYRDGTSKHIDPNHLTLFEQEGWKKGQPKYSEWKESISKTVSELWKDPEYREHMRQAHRGNSCHKGMKVSEEGRKRMSEAGKRRRWVHKGTEKIHIDVEQLQTYLDQGWLRGTGRKVSRESIEKGLATRIARGHNRPSEETRKKMSISNKRRWAIRKGLTN